MFKKVACLALGIMALVAPARRASALPMWSRKYRVPCAECHTVAPALNKFGDAFLANNFRYPGLESMKSKPLPVPVSLLATFEYEKPVNASETGPRFTELELFSGDAFRVSRNPEWYGSYFLTTLLAHAPGEGTAGDLEQAYVTLPVAGKRGQWQVGLGQSFPLMYQLNPLNELFDPVPWALARGTRNFAEENALPGVRLDYFSGRGSVSRDGDYLSIVAPFSGSFALNNNFRWGKPDGAFVDYFHRTGRLSVGANAWYNAGDYKLSGLVRFDLDRWRLYGALSQIAGPGSRGVQFSAETDYFFSHRLAGLARFETGGGTGDLDGVAFGAVWYPEKSQTLRIAVEHRQNSGDRTTLVRAIGQF